MKTNALYLSLAAASLLVVSSANHAWAGGGTCKVEGPELVEPYYFNPHTTNLRALQQSCEQANSGSGRVYNIIAGDIGADALKGAKFTFFAGLENER